MEANHGFGRFQTAAEGIRTYDGANPLPPARPSLAPADLYLAELRSVSEFSDAAAFSGFLAEDAGRAVTFGDGLPLQADQARGTEGHRRRVPAALISLRRRRLRCW